MAAIDIFIYCGKLPQADWLIGAAVKLSEGSDEHREIMQLAANIRYDLGLESEVLALCKRLSALDPSDPAPWHLAAMVSEDAGQTEAEIESLERVLELSSNDTSAERLRLTDNLIEIGDREAARRHFSILREQSAELVAENPLTHAKLLLLEGEVARADRIITKTLEDNPQSTEAMLLSSQQLLSRGDLEKAVEQLERLLEIEPMKFQAHYRLGQAYARQGKRELAKKHLALHRQILDLRVQIHALERRAGRNPNDTEARAELIGAYELLGMKSQADFWRRASQ